MTGARASGGGGRSGLGRGGGRRFGFGSRGAPLRPGLCRSTPRGRCALRATPQSPDGAFVPHPLGRSAEGSIPWLHRPGSGKGVWQHGGLPLLPPQGVWDGGHWAPQVRDLRLDCVTCLKFMYFSLAGKKPCWPGPACRAVQRNQHSGLASPASCLPSRRFGLADPKIGRKMVLWVSTYERCPRKEGV